MSLTSQRVVKKRGIFPKPATNILRAWLFQNLAVSKLCSIGAEPKNTYSIGLRPAHQALTWSLKICSHEMSRQLYFYCSKVMFTLLRIVSSTTVAELYFYLCAYFIFTWLFGHFGRKVDY